MRSGRPHSADGSWPSAPQESQYPQQSYADDGRSVQRQVPFGPEVSWPSGYYDLEFRDGAYSYPEETRDGALRADVSRARDGQRAALPPGEHPYAAFGPLGYGDPGYQDPGYEGPAAQDAGYTQPPGNDLVRRHPALDGFTYDEPKYADGDLPDPRYPDTRFGQLGYDPDNGFYAQQDDSRLAYDDPRYADRTRQVEGFDSRGFDVQGFDAQGFDAQGFDRGQRPASGQPGFEETRFDMPAYRPGYDDAGPDGYGPSGYAPSGPSGYGDSGYGDSGYEASGYAAPERDVYDSDYPDASGFDHGQDYSSARERGFADTLAAPTGVLTPQADMRADVRGQGAGARGRGTGVLAPPVPANQPHPSFSDTVLDNYPAAILADPAEEPADDAEKNRGRRRSGTKDRKQWVALGAVVVVAAGAIVGVLKLVSPSHPSGPAHQVEAPSAAGVYQRKPNLETQMGLPQLRAQVLRMSAGQATNVVDGVYQAGTAGPGGAAQIFGFVGGHLDNASPTDSISGIIHKYSGAQMVSAGPLGGEAACVAKSSGTQGAVAMCVWFDNDSFGELVSPSMSPATLANVMTTTRPDFEQVISK